MYENKEEIAVIEVKVSAYDETQLSITARTFYGDYGDTETVNSVSQKNNTESDPNESEKDQLVQILDFIGSKIIVTHDHGFEIFYVDNECGRLNVDKIANTVLDTRKLAQLIHPQVPSYDLNYLIFEIHGTTAPLCYMEKVALLYFNLLQDAKNKGLDIYKAAIFSAEASAN